MLEFWSLVHSGSVALGTAKNVVSRWSRGLGRRYFIRHVEEESSQNSAHPCLQLHRTPCRAAEPTNRYASLVPLHRITASRRRGQSASPALSIKVSRFRSDVTCQIVTLHRATTTRRLEATTPEKGAPTITRTAMARTTTRTTTARRTTRAAAG